MMEQRTEEWFAARLGKATGSRITDIVARGKGGAPSASRANYRAQIVCERLTGARAESFTSSAMQWGTETEPQARANYSLTTGNTVAEVGFIDHPRIAMAGASPDGVIEGQNGLVEIKCPQSATHIATLLGEPIPDKYIVQMQWQMACTGAEWCDFVSFDPRLPDHMQLFIKRVPADPAHIAALETAVAAFLAEVDAEIEALNQAYPVAA
jgi:putative phage-type endonuclease